jgi:hypothetical protein
MKIYGRIRVEGNIKGFMMGMSQHYDVATAKDGV